MGTRACQVANRSLDTAGTPFTSTLATTSAPRAVPRMASAVASVYDTRVGKMIAADGALASPDPPPSLASSDGRGEPPSPDEPSSRENAAGFSLEPHPKSAGTSTQTGPPQQT